MGQTLYSITAFENVGPERMWSYAPGDPLVHVGTFEVYADSVEAALERLWVVGNRMGIDAQGNAWPKTHRSMCSGDFAVVHNTGTEYVALMAGWGRVVDLPGKTNEVMRTRTPGGITITWERDPVSQNLRIRDFDTSGVPFPTCTSDDPNNHQGETCPVHECNGTDAAGGTAIIHPAFLPCPTHG